MCHPEVLPGTRTPEVTRAEVLIPVGGGESMPAMLATPDTGPAPSVLVIADVFGRSPFYEDLAARIATAGFEALLPDFFHRVGPLAERTREAAFARRRGGPAREPALAQGAAGRRRPGRHRRLLHGRLVRAPPGGHRGEPRVRL